MIERDWKENIEIPENLINRKEEDPKEILGKNARPTMKHLVQQGMFNKVFTKKISEFIASKLWHLYYVHP